MYPLNNNAAAGPWKNASRTKGPSWAEAPQIRSWSVLRSISSFWKQNLRLRNLFEKINKTARGLEKSKNTTTSITITITIIITFTFTFTPPGGSKNAAMFFGHLAFFAKFRPASGDPSLKFGAPVWAPRGGVFTAPGLEKRKKQTGARRFTMLKAPRN